MEKIRKAIETVSNVGIIILALFLGYFLISQYYHSPIKEENFLQKGMKLPFDQVDFSKSEKSLLMVLSTKCHFSAESLPFYERMSKQKPSDRELRIIALLPQDSDDSKKYLDSHNVSVNEVIIASPAQLQVHGTPTLIEVDKNGVVLEIWNGKLPPDKEREVLASISDQGGV